MIDEIEQGNSQKIHDLEAHACEAINCRIATGTRFCGSHYRFLSKEIKDNLQTSRYSKASVRKAIEYLAEKEGKEISAIEQLRLNNLYGVTNE